METYIKDINGKKHISIYDLIKLGFDFPPAGTKGYTVLGLFSDNDPYYKFHAPAESPYTGQIWVSPFLSDVGKRLISKGDFWIEFSPEIFIYKK